jgi:hypothetical protein
MSITRARPLAASRLTPSESEQSPFSVRTASSARNKAALTANTPQSMQS